MPTILDQTKFENLIHTYAAGTITRAQKYDTSVSNVMAPVLANLQDFAHLIPTGYSPEVIALMYDSAIEQALQAIESDYVADLLTTEVRMWVAARVLDLPEVEEGG